MGAFSEVAFTHHNGEDPCAVCRGVRRVWATLGGARRRPTTPGN